ncbi:MAG: SH3 domain-containing protein [Anaerolineae bacterium]
MKAITMRYLSLIAILVFSLSRFVQAQDTVCPNTPALDLAVGDVVVVNDGEAQNVRQQATTDATKLAVVPPGEYLTVWGGPSCADGYRWWQVEYDRQVGWTAEGTTDGGQYWLSKIETQILEKGNVLFEVSRQLASEITYVDEQSSGGDGFDVPPNRKFSLEGYPLASEWGAYAWYWLGIDPKGGVMVAPRTETIDSWLGLGNLGVELNDNQPEVGLAKYVAPQGRYDDPHMAYLHLKNGMAQRSLLYQDPTGFSPDNYQPIQPRLIYYVSGLTADGQHYIRALFPIEVQVDLPPFPEIPHFSMEDDQRVFTEYAIAVNKTFDQLPPTAFTPRLALLDAMMRSIEVIGEIELEAVR